MSDFRNQLLGFSVKIQRMERDVFVGVTEEVHKSIVEGSPITGAAGQPVDTGALRASWTPAFLDANTWQDTTHLIYAPVIEDNLRGATLRSSVGGFHSVRYTRVGFSRIVDYVVQKVRGTNA
jgi:hypothetical protein